MSKPGMARRAEEIEERTGRKLTNRQREFARHYVDAQHSNAECARLAGYSAEPGVAAPQAYKLLDPKLFPHVTHYINELREERERRYGVTLMGQLKRLRELSIGAEDSGQFSAAINAEKTRSALGGLTVDRRETNHFHAIENMTRDEIEGRLVELRKQHPAAFIEAEYEVLDGPKTGNPTVEPIETENTEKVALESD